METICINGTVYQKNSVPQAVKDWLKEADMLIYLLIFEPEKAEDYADSKG